MRTLILALMLSGVTAMTYSQPCVIANQKQNIIYVGVPNPMSVAVNGKWCKDFILTTNNGRIEKTPIDDCSYDLFPATVGKASLIILSKKDRKELGRMEFRAKRIPDPVAMVGGKNGGEIRKNILKAQIGIIAVLTQFDFDARFIVEQFTITLLHTGKPIFTRECTGARFPPEVIRSFDRLQAGDQVLFTEMTYRGPDGRTNGLLPVEFRIVE